MLSFFVSLCIDQSKKMWDVDEPKFREALYKKASFSEGFPLKVTPADSFRTNFSSIDWNICYSLFESA